MTEPRFKKKSGTGTPPSDAQGKLLESAQHIWMAGLGAFSRAQDQGSKLFEALIREGQTIESKTRHFTSGRANDVRDRMENTVGNVKERAADTWDRLEKVFEDRVSRALTRLGVPGRDEMHALVERIEELNRSVRAQQAYSASAARPTSAPANKPAARGAARKSPAGKASGASTSGKNSAAGKTATRKPGGRKTAVKSTGKRARSARTKS